MNPYLTILEYRFFYFYKNNGGQNEDYAKAGNLSPNRIG